MLNLREIYAVMKDFSLKSPIEPSTVGGGKLADRIVASVVAGNVNTTESQFIANHLRATQCQKASTQRNQWARDGSGPQYVEHSRIVTGPHHTVSEIPQGETLFFC